MGKYLNPNNMSKESWLKTNAKPAGTNYPTTHTTTIEGEPHTLAVLMDNGMFTACGLADSHGEMEALTRRDDPRFKYYFWVPNTLTYCFAG